MLGNRQARNESQGDEKEGCAEMENSLFQRPKMIIQDQNKSQEGSINGCCKLIEVEACHQRQCDTQAAKNHPRPG